VHKLPDESWQRGPDYSAIMAIMATTTSMKINRGAACRICRRRNYDLLRE
jgi:hypothetical protein